MDDVLRMVVVVVCVCYFSNSGLSCPSLPAFFFFGLAVWIQMDFE